MGLNFKEMASDILFWNVDTQIDFMKADGKLYVQDAELIEANLAKLTDFAKANNVRVVNTCDYHNENSSEISDKPDFLQTFPPHCLEHTLGQEFIKETNPDSAAIFNWTKNYTESEIEEMIKSERNIVIRKDVFDAFANNNNAENILNVLAPKLVIVYGVATNVCVDFAVKGLLKRGYKVLVAEDAIKGLPNIPSPIEEWKSAGVKFVKTQEIQNIIG